MKIIDISWPISTRMTTYKDKKNVHIEPTKTFDTDRVRESMLQLGSHTGTHVDAPSHFIKNGKNYDELPLDMFIGPCTVLDMTHVDTCITHTHLEQENIQSGDIILLKTDNSILPYNAPFNTSFIYLEKSGAEYLAQKKVKSVGIDYLGIERMQPDHNTHITLFKHNVGIIEGLRLKDVNAGSYMLYCLPLAVTSSDAAPARAVLIQ